jgi:ribosomal protein S18 acetylase RimI-like enzyme
MTAQEERLQISLNFVVTIRKMRYEDLRKLEWYGQFTHFRHLFMRSYQGQQDGSRFLLVADSKGFPIGRLFIQFGNKKNTKYSDGVNRAYLYSFQVMDLFQGQGLGTRLIRVAESLLLQRGFSISTIGVVKTNEGALRLYQREGYTIYGEDEGRWAYIDQRGIERKVHEPCWLLEKSLRLS